MRADTDCPAGARYAAGVRFLRRSADPATDSADAVATPAQVSPSEPGRTTGKGRPTPKRREAEAKRRGPVAPPPRTQREASRLAKANRPDRDQRRRDAAERRERMAAGDQRYLLPRDRGPVREYVRDLVDSRPHLSGMFMPLAIIVVASLLLPFPNAQRILSLFCTIALLTMLAEGILLGAQTTRKARARFPDEQISALGIGWYAFTRASQLRRLRVPKPRVERGATV
jgi:Protein of unknown function (DUF3043)